jgi:hypothetical protein
MSGCGLVSHASGYDLLASRLVNMTDQATVRFTGMTLLYEINLSGIFFIKYYILFV